MSFGSSISDMTKNSDASSNDMSNISNFGLDDSKDGVDCNSELSFKK